MPYLLILNSWYQRRKSRSNRSKSLQDSDVSKSRTLRERLSTYFSVRLGDFSVTPNGRFAVSALYKDVIVTRLQVRWWQQSLAEKRQQVLRGHKDEITAVAVTPDGHHIVSAAQDNTVRVWHKNQDDFHANILAVSCEATAVAIAADGQQIVFATTDKKLHLWHIEDDKATELTEKEAEITAVTLTHDEQAVVVACRDHTVEVWDLAAKQRVATYMGDAIPLHLSVIPTNNAIAVGDENGRIHLLKLEGLRNEDDIFNSCNS